MKKTLRWCLAVCSVLALSAGAWAADEVRVKLAPTMVTNEAGKKGNPQAMVDEQDKIVTNPPTEAAETIWKFPTNDKSILPISAYLDLGQERPLSSLYIYDTYGTGKLVISTGKPGEWTTLTTYDCKSNKAWVKIPVDTQTRYLRFTRDDLGSAFAEIALYEYAPEDWKTVHAQKETETKAKAQGLADSKNRQQVDLGEPFGKLLLVDEVNVAATDPGHLFKADPANASKVQTILGKPCRVLDKTPGEGAYMTFRLGQFKQLKAGAAYVLEVEYPEDVARSMVVVNAGNETMRGFHTGAALGDAYRPKYVNNLNESVATPLSDKYKTWTMYFNLHDHFAELNTPRGKGTRPLTPADGFNVTIAQFSAENLPIEHGAAVARIRLFEVPDPSKLNVTFNLPPKDLPRRHLFWREEMADGVLDYKDTQPGLNDPIDWYRFKANQMQFLGMHTYTKDLLEFGACQHWDPTDGGGNTWVFHDGVAKAWWGQIVKVMGDHGFDILPYYEYAGSKGSKGLGPQRRAKPLTRDDAFTHIKWIENANADITDPDTYDDFKKMLDFTVVKFKDQAHFIGAWIRPRSQIPMGFGEATRKRFADQVNNGQEVTRQQLIADPKLLAKYETWWYGKRREFLMAMRDYLRSKGIDEATILYTTCASEPGVSFKTWDPIMVADDISAWKKIIAENAKPNDKAVQVITPQEIAAKNTYLDALLSPPLNWGGYEIDHANPASDPLNYKNTEGVLLTHAFNRLYTVSNPQTFDAFRTPSGLAIIRHYSLNENMMFDKNDKPKLGYFACDVERAGPYCMMGEAMAMANGDPRFVGYLVGRTFARGFPKYVRDFNTAFLALPALPSQIVPQGASDQQVIVRSIATPTHGTYFAIVNTAMTDKTNVEIRLPAGKVLDAATNQPLPVQGGKVQMTLYPYQLRALHVETTK